MNTSQTPTTGTYALDLGVLQVSPATFATLRELAQEGEDIESIAARALEHYATTRRTQQRLARQLLA